LPDIYNSGGEQEEVEEKDEEKVEGRWRRRWRMRRRTGTAALTRCWRRRCGRT
jgi:hypothetical protein